MTQTTVKENDGCHPSSINLVDDTRNHDYIPVSHAYNSVEEDVTNLDVTISEDTEKRFTLLSVEKLFTHPLNSSVYGENENLEELIQAIARSQWIEPIVVTPAPSSGDKYCIISGNSRYKAALKLGIEQIYAEVKFFKSELEELEAFLIANVQREKTIEQKVREGWIWEKIEKEKAQQRMKSGQAIDPPANLPEGRGEVREIVAGRVGLGSRTYGKASAAVREMDNETDSDRHQQLKELLSKPKGVDAAYKLAKPQSPKKIDKKSDRWLPKVGEKISIIAGPHKGAQGTVTVILAMCALVYIDGTPESKREQIQFRDMQPVEEAFSSVKEEVAAKQKELGLGEGEQVLPSIPRNAGIPKEIRQQASVINLSAKGDALVTEVAIALIGLSAKQLLQVIDIAQKEFSPAQIEAIWRSMEPHFLHKAS